MNQKITFLALATIGGALTLPSPAQTGAPTELAPVVVEGSRAKIGPEQASHPMLYVQIKNFQDETLGRIKDLGIDLVSGRIVEVLVISDDSLHVDNKVVAVPPLALFADGANQVYRLKISAAQFKSAAAVDLDNWAESGRSDRVAAAYRLFGAEIFFLAPGEKPSPTAERPKSELGYVQLSSRILDLPIKNFDGTELGKVWSLSLDIPRARILHVIVVSQGNFRIKNVVPAMALSFNPARDGLILNNTPEELENEPRYLFTAAAYGQEAYYHQEAYAGPHTTVALVQGSSYRDVDQTVRINRDIRAANLTGAQVEVGTLNERVTLRGTVATEADKATIATIAVAASRLELVDNQISVGPPATVL